MKKTLITIVLFVSCFSTLCQIRISNLTAADSVADANIFPLVQSGQTKKVAASTLATYTSIRTVSEITLDEIDSSTTAKLIYGVNVIDTASATDFCARLPLAPKKGRTVTVINNSGRTIRIFPSMAGGSINGVVNGYSDIVSDGKAIDFICYENPNPGMWSVTVSRVTSIVIGEMSVNHTNGVADFFVGTGTPTSSAIGVSLSGTPYVLGLTPAASYWKSEAIPTTAVRLKVYTNITTNDCAQDFDVNNNGIIVFMSQAYQNSSNAATYGTRSMIRFYKNVGVGNDIDEATYSVNGGVLNAPPNVGDLGTFYGDAAISNTTAFDNQVGTGGTYSRFYYIFAMQVAANVATKVYKFQFVLETN